MNIQNSLLELLALPRIRVGGDVGMSIFPGNITVH